MSQPISKPFLLLVLVPLLSCQSVTEVHVTTAELDDASLFNEQSSAAIFSLINIQTSLPGGETVRGLAVRLDDRLIGECDASDSDMCLQDLRIPPGPHALDVRIFCQDPATTRSLGCSYSLWDRIWVGAREHMVYDFAESVAHPDEQDRYITRAIARQIDAPDCLVALEGLAYASSCTPDQLEEAIERADEAMGECSPRRLRGENREVARVLLLRAVENHFSLPMSRCYAGHERASGHGSRPHGQIPSVVEHGLRSSPMQVSSWVWARSVLPRSAADEGSPEALLENVRRGLYDIRPRLAALTEIIDAFLDESNIPALRQRAMSEPFSFDPRHPNGQRHYYIVGARWHDPAYDEHLARQVAEDSTLNCSNQYAQDLLLPYFLEQRQLSLAEWQAFQGMISRTPPDERVQRYCTHAFNPNVQCEVPLTDRLRWFAQWDCSEARHPALRSEALEAELRTGRANDISVELSGQLYQEFAHCFPGPPPR